MKWQSAGSAPALVDMDLDVVAWPALGSQLSLYPSLQPM